MRTKIGKTLWVFVVFLTLGASTAWAGNKSTRYTVNGITYNCYMSGEKAGTAEVANNMFCAGDIVIESYVELYGTQYPVTSIAAYAFSMNYDLTSLVIPNSVTSIGKKAFQKCSALTSLVIPYSVQTFGERMFDECTNLRSLYIDVNCPLSVLKYSTVDTVYVRKKSDYSDEELNSVPTGIEIVELAVADYPYNKDGYATMCSRYPFVLPRGCKAGLVVGTDGDALLVDYAYKAGDIVPEATPVLIKGRTSEAGGRMPMTYPDSYEGMERTTLNNLLVGVYEDTEVEGNEAYSHYVLGCDADGENVGFYWGNEFSEGYGISNVPANRCYLEVPYEEDIPNRFLLEKAEDVTAIKDIDDEESAISDAPVFDLTGRKVASPAKGSIYVRNCKTFVAQ